MKRIVAGLGALAATLWLAASASAQVETDWIARYDGPPSQDDWPYAIDVDTAGNVYVAGTVNDPSTVADYATLKYDADGNLLWAVLYDGPVSGLDEANDVGVDLEGNVYVTGLSTGSGTQADWATLKYDAAGTFVWERRENNFVANGEDVANALEVDEAGNIYVTGRYTAWHMGFPGYTSLEFMTVKYDPDGNAIWLRTFDGGGDDEALALDVDALGNVYVTGWSQGVGRDYLTVKYSTDGTLLWSQSYNGPGNLDDTPRDLVVDDAGNVFVTGYCQVNLNNTDYATTKYDPSGTPLWTRLYNGPGGWHDWAEAVGVDTGGNAFVAGTSDGNSSQYDYATLKYDPAGTLLWERRFDDVFAHGWDFASALDVDASGNVYVTGWSTVWHPGIPVELTEDYRTIKYDPDGGADWSLIYNGPGNKRDEPTDILVDRRGNVYVTGMSPGVAATFYYDFATIKYSQCFCPCHGDPQCDSVANVQDVVQTVNVAFRGSAPAFDPNCPRERTDVNCDGFSTVQDVVKVVNVAFRGANPTTEFCDPCAP
ncbi:MAG: SBBP repeat-containing protein [Candidatus Zixiibacteriota bacterium]